MPIRMVSFNINSLRARLHQLEAVIESHHPEVIGLQETKVNDPDFPLEAIQALGYHAHFHGQKGHYGVATLTKKPTLWAQSGFEGDAEDAQRRVSTVAFELEDGTTCVVVNGYFPQGESRKHPVKFPMKRMFYAAMKKHVNGLMKNYDQVLVMGDVNISYEDIDIGIGPVNAKRWLSSGKCSFLPEERAWMTALHAEGLTDLYRMTYPESTELSWFDYRSKGFDDDPKRGLRIDVLLANDALKARCVGSGIDHEVRAMDKPSDHCPVWADFE